MLISQKQFCQPALKATKHRTTRQTSQTIPNCGHVGSTQQGIFYCNFQATIKQLNVLCCPSQDS